MSSSTSEDISDERIWSEDDFREFLGHDDPEIRQWALRKLGLCIDGELLVEVAVEHLANPNRDVAFRAFKLAKTSPSESLEPHCEELREYANRESTTAATRGRCLGLLAGLGDIEGRERLLERAGEAPCGWAEWRGRDRKDFIETIDEEYGDSRLPWDTDLLEAIITAGAGELADPLFDTLEALNDPDERGRLLEDAISRAGGLLVDRHRLETLEWKEFDEIEPVFRSSYELADLERQRALREGQVEAIAEGDWATVAESSLEVIELLAEAGLDEVDSRSIDWTTACARALRARPSRLDDVPELRAGFAVSLERAGRRTYGMEQALSEAEGVEQILETSDELYGHLGARFTSALETRWEATADSPDRRREVTETLERWLDETDQHEAFTTHVQIARRLEGFDLSGPLNRLIDDLDSDGLGDRPPETYDLLEDLLRDHPEVLRTRGEELLGRSSQTRLATLFALGDVNAPWACDLLLDQLDDLLTYPDVWEAFAEVGDPRAIERAIEEWRAGEEPTARCICLLAKLDDRIDEIDEAIREDFRAHRASEEQGVDDIDAVLEGDVRSPAELSGDEPMSLMLQCTECERTYFYDLDQLFLDVDQGGENSVFELYTDFVPDRVVICKNCGASDRHRLTKRAKLQFAPHLFQSAELLTGEAPDEDASRIVPMSFELWDGTTIRRPSEAIDYLRDFARRNPDDGEAWLRLGNLCDRFNQQDEALEAWQRAVENDEREVEAAHNLVQAFLEDRADVPDASHYLLTALHRLPEGRVSPKTRRPLAEALVGMLRTMVEGSGHPAAMTVTSRPRTTLPGAKRDFSTVDLSTIDLRRVERWDRLAELFARDVFATVAFGPDPPESVGRLEKLVDSEGALPRCPSGPASRKHETSDPGNNDNSPYVKSEEEKIGRNDPCPCGSGRKYKKCCLRKHRQR